MRYRDENTNLRSHIRTLRWINTVLFIVIAALWHGWEQAKYDLRIHIPPDLRSGAMLAAGQIHPANVYAFTHYILQQLYHWPQDGEKEYGLQIFRMAPYLTPGFRSILTADMELRGKRGELTGRTRVFQTIPGHDYEDRRVDILGEGVWVVWIDAKIQETVKGMPVKNVNIRYPVRLIRYDVDPETNPWGLALDGFAGEGPRHLSEEEFTEEPAA